jgi:hypothetical protein
VEIGEVFKKVRRKVMEETKGRQVPWDSSSITEDFYFVPSPLINVPQPIRVIHPVSKPQG